MGVLTRYHAQLTSFLSTLEGPATGGGISEEELNAAVLARAEAQAIVDAMQDAAAAGEEVDDDEVAAAQAALIKANEEAIEALNLNAWGLNPANITLQNGDWDTVLTTGWYNGEGGTTNRPEGFNGFERVRVSRLSISGSAIVIQEAFDGATGALAHRRYHGGTQQWAPWVILAADDDTVQLERLNVLEAMLLSLSEVGAINAPLSNLAGSARQSSVVGVLTPLEDGPITIIFKGTVASGTAGLLVTETPTGFAVNEDITNAEFGAFRGAALNDFTDDRITPTETEQRYTIQGTANTPLEFVVYAGGGSDIDAAAVTIERSIVTEQAEQNTRLSNAETGIAALGEQIDGDNGLLEQLTSVENGISDEATAREEADTAQIARLTALEEWLAGGLPGQVPSVPDPDGEPTWVYPYGFGRVSVKFPEHTTIANTFVGPDPLVGVIDTSGFVAGTWEIEVHGFWSYDQATTDYIAGLYDEANVSDNNVGYDDAIDGQYFRIEPKDIAGTDASGGAGTDQLHPFSLKAEVTLVDGGERVFSYRHRPVTPGVEATASQVRMIIKRVGD